jgi:hypothetical protein
VRRTNEPCHESRSFVVTIYTYELSERSEQKTNESFVFRSFGSRSKEDSYYVVPVKANESNPLGRLVRSCLLLIDLPRPPSPQSKECQSNSGNGCAFRPSLSWRSFGTWPIRIPRIEPNHGSVGFIGSRANDDRDCPRDAGQDVASRQEMHKSASCRSVRSGSRRGDGANEQGKFVDYTGYLLEGSLLQCRPVAVLSPFFQPGL